MTQTYTMKLRSCETRPAIEVEFPNIARDRIEQAITEATLAFRSVEVVADETGEIIFSHYVDSDFFSLIQNHGEAIDVLRYICYNRNC